MVPDEYLINVPSTCGQEAGTSKHYYPDGNPWLMEAHSPLIWGEKILGF